jgi:hypothetical protein
MVFRILANCDKKGFEPKKTSAGITVAQKSPYSGIALEEIQNKQK